MLNILFIGDVNGRPGRDALKALLPSLVKERRIDFVIANGENSAAGFGITDSTFTDMLSAGVHAVTLGNHLYDKKEALPIIENDPRLVRPANLPDGNPGRGFAVFTVNKDGKNVNIAVANLTGRIFMSPADCPFRAADRFLKDIAGNAKIVIVDMHAEATSEKMAMGYYLDGRVTAVLGTHTHVMTADERVLEKGTAYISDAGMTGPFDSVIGVKKEIILRKFLTGMPERFEIAEGDVRLNAVLISADEQTGRATSIERIQLKHGQ